MPLVIPSVQAESGTESRDRHIDYDCVYLQTVADSEAPDCHCNIRFTSSPRFTKQSSIKCFVKHLGCAVLM